MTRRLPFRLLFIPLTVSIRHAMLSHIIIRYKSLTRCAATAVLLLAAAMSPRQAGAGNVVDRLIDYFSHTNERPQHRGLDFSLIGGPYYNSDMGAGIGLVASGLYGSSGVDTLQPPSNVGFFGKVSTKGFAEIGVSGTHVGRADKVRIGYKLDFFSDPSDYWGIGYAMCNDNSSKSHMKRIGFSLSGDALWRLLPGLYAGPGIAVDYIHPFEIGNPALLDGERPTVWTQGVGVSLNYDTRDVLTNPHRGIYARVSQCFRPRFLGNRYRYTSTELMLNTYHSVWRGGILATNLRADLNYGNPSWNMLAKTGGSSFMRGYYEGRYRDKCMAGVQVELRQHVWRRSGMVAWAGCATVFARPAQIHFDRLLPNCGLGYRWEFKKDVNVRLDLGLGKAGQCGFMFSINEAF